MGRGAQEQASPTLRAVSLYLVFLLYFNRTLLTVSPSRFKPEMWQKVAEEMQVPWRAAEAMHWQLGEHDMARRAGVVPFALSTAAAADHPMVGGGIHHHHRSPSSSRGHHGHHHGHGHSQSQGSLPRDIPSLASPRYASMSGGSSSRGGPPPSFPSIPLSATGPGRPIAARRDSLPSRPSFGPPIGIPPPPPPPPPALEHHIHHHYYGDIGGPPGSSSGGPPIGLAPIQTSGFGGGPGAPGPGGSGGRGGVLPSVAEMTTGVSPYNTPAYTQQPPPPPPSAATLSPIHTHSGTVSPGPPSSGGGASSGGGPGPPLLPGLMPQSYNPLAPHMGGGPGPQGPPPPLSMAPMEPSMMGGMGGGPGMGKRRAMSPDVLGYDAPPGSGGMGDGGGNGGGSSSRRKPLPPSMDFPGMGSGRR